MTDATYSATARLTGLRTSVFLGREPGDGGRRCWSAAEDSVGVVGPPRYGKTSGVIIPTVLLWDGPVVSTSTRGDIVDFTAAQRRAVASADGGDVFVYDPFGSERHRTSMRWSPLSDCADPSVCFRRVAAMTAVAGGGMQDGDHWRAGAASILRAYFHAAALEGLPLRVVRRWIARQEVRDPVAILRLAATDADLWADDLEATTFLGDRERGSFYSVARNCLEATAEPHVLNSCATTDLDVDRFLRTRSSLFVIGPSHQQQSIAPLIAGLVDSIAQRAAELAALDGGRLRAPLLLALDEVANIAPLQSLPSLVSEGGGRGIITLWAAQSLAQLRARYGGEGAAVVLAATTAKLIFGGLSNGGDLSNISMWAGEITESQSTVQVGPQRVGEGSALPAFKPGGAAGDGGAEASRSTSQIYRPALPVSAIQMLPPLNAWLFYRSDAPLRVLTPPAATVPEFAALRPETVAWQAGALRG